MSGIQGTLHISGIVLGPLQAVHYGVVEPELGRTARRGEEHLLSFGEPTTDDLHGDRDGVHTVEATLLQELL
jgi:hypothetical protein